MKRQKRQRVNYQISISFDVPITKKYPEKDIDVTVNCLQKDIEEIFNEWKKDFSNLEIKNIKWNE